jgi:hypothetical protein
LRSQALLVGVQSLPLFLDSPLLGFEECHALFIILDGERQSEEAAFPGSKLVELPCYLV